MATNDSDVDDGASLSYALDAPALAGLTFNADGSYSFDPSNAAYQHLAQGATTSVVASYTVTDEHGATEHSHPHHHRHRHQRCAGGGGRHRQPATEDATITGTVATNDSDVDDGAVAELRARCAGAGRSDLQRRRQLQLRSGNAAYQHLAQGATTDVVASYTVTDEHGATDSGTLTITVTGTNDAPVAVADTNSGNEERDDHRHGRRPTTATSTTARR